MEELEKIFTEMLNHIDKHKESYNKPQWDNKSIVKAWVKSHDSRLKEAITKKVIDDFKRCVDELGGMDDSSNVRYWIATYYENNCTPPPNKEKVD